MLLPSMWKKNINGAWRMDVGVVVFSDKPADGEEDEMEYEESEDKEEELESSGSKGEAEAENNKYN